MKMITRIVKMTFRKEEISTFLQIFEEKKSFIRSFEGCHEVKLLQAGNIFFTYSTWESESHLENYRISPLFIETWQKVKPLFEAKPAAWTCEIIQI